MLSRKRHFIFIHIYKNAGTSVKNALMPFSVTRRQRIANKRALNGIIHTSKSLQLPFPGHMKASELIKIMGRDVFKEFFSFAIVRNPWDWQVSLYNYMLINTSHPQHDFIKNLGSFNSYIEWRCYEEVRLQKDFIYSEHGELQVDYVGRFENIENDFLEICSKIGISASLSRLNVSNSKPYQEYYNSSTKDLVARAFKTDIDCFGYNYDT